ncbi:MAG: Si-specific NAD(P)(+) transhydrogenase [Deltaproteobacteria bacterium]|nr:Si-specific NAD(P)(+) transhydrogenase [Deltaproteobacteria bacterium]
MREVDVLVLGGGPAGCRAATDSARLRPGATVALAERMGVVGGVCVNTGTIPSKTLREAVLYLAGYRQRAYYGSEYRLKSPITQADLVARTQHVIDQELRVMHTQLGRVGVELLQGDARFLGPHEVEIASCEDRSSQVVRASQIFIATGSEAVRTAGFPYDGTKVVVPDELFALRGLPRSMVIVGGGVIGCEYASIYALAGIAVTVIDPRPGLLAFLDSEIRGECDREMVRNGVTFRLGQQVESVACLPDGAVATRLAGGETVTADLVMTAAGRAGNVASLDLRAAGLKADDNGRIGVDSTFRTAVPHIFAVGDVVGFPSLASAATEQGRVAAAMAAERQPPPLPESLPIGIYTIPEMAAVGKSEDQLRRARVDYVASRARWSDISRGHITGDEVGMLKMLWHPDTRRILGVHIVGEGAAELIHLGHAVMSLGGTVDYFVEAVFNYPTLAQAYKVAVEGIPGRPSITG